MVGDELGELLFQQLVFRLEARNEVKDFFQNLPKAQTAVHGGSFAQLVKGVILLGFIKDLTVDVVDDTVPLPGFDSFGNGLILPHGLRKPVEKHAVNLHPFGADGFFTDIRQIVSALIFVGEREYQRRHRGVPVAAVSPRDPRQRQDFIIIELGLEVFAITEEVEELESRLVPFCDFGFEALVKRLFQETVWTGAAPLDLDEVSR